MNLHNYHRTEKDSINSSIMEIASDLAVKRLIETHSQLFEHFVEPADPNDPDGGTCYKPEFQDEYNQYYDEEYERLANLMKFDIGEDDGLRKADMTDKDRYTTILSESQCNIDIQKRFIVDVLKKNGGTIHFVPDLDNEGCVDFPVASTLYGKHDNPRINITDVYLCDNMIYVDGVDDRSLEKRTKFFVYPEHIADVFSFVGHALNY